MTGDMSSTLSQNVRKSVNLSVSVLGQKSRCQVAVMTEQDTVSMHVCVCVCACKLDKTNVRGMGEVILFTLDCL